MRPFLFFVGATLAITPSAPATEQRFTSGLSRVSLIELYTSEGCSSCPPAERWLSSLRDAPGLWRDFVPVALHVNYWDRLGWRDRFATPEFTQREHAYAAKWASNSVYTPCFVRDGTEWRADARPPGASAEKVGILAVTLTGSNQARAEFVPATARGAHEELELHVALLGSGFTSKVTAGENRGETLRHEFVALVVETHPFPSSNAGVPAVEFNVPQPKITDAPRRALAIWVTRQGQLAPLQATGGWLEPNRSSPKQTVGFEK
jgi:hypothetical protein